MKKHIIQNIGIFLLLFFLCFLIISKTSKEVHPKIIKIAGKPYKVLEQVIDTQYFPKTKIVEKKGKDIYHDTTIYVPVPISLDTLNIIKSYFSKNVFKDTLKLGDSLGFISVVDTIYQNDILSRKYQYKIIQKLITERIIVEQVKKNEFYFGAGIGISKTNINNINANFLLKSKKDNIFGLGLGVDINGNRFVNTSMYWKIKK